MGKAFDYLVFPLLIPFIVLWLLAARALSILAPFLIFPALTLKSRLYWCLPFTPCIWKQYGLAGKFMEVGFLGSYTMNGEPRPLATTGRHGERARPPPYAAGREPHTPRFPPPSILCSRAEAVDLAHPPRHARVLHCRLPQVRHHQPG